MYITRDSIRLDALLKDLDYFSERLDDSLRNLMFDPSLLLNGVSLSNTILFMKKYSELFRFYIPGSFYALFTEEYTSIELTSNLLPVYVFFFGGKYPRTASLEDIISLIKEMIKEYKEYIHPFKVDFHHRNEYLEFYKILEKEVKNKLVREILFEEYVFLKEYSAIVAKTRAAIKKLKNCGVVTIEYMKKAAEKLIR